MKQRTHQIAALLFSGYCTLAVAEYPPSDSTALPELPLVHALPVQGPENFQPSGLCRTDDGDLLTVSDKHTGVFRLSRNETAVRAELYLQPSPPPLTPAYLPYGHRLKNWVSGLLADSPYDWEGITCRGDDLYLLSEAYRAILHYNRTTKDTQWIFLDTSLIQSAGLHTAHNTGPEGITLDSKNTLWVTFERQPAALMNVTQQQLIFQLNTQDEYQYPHDLTALSSTDDALYWVARNLRQVCRAAWSGNLTQPECFSYRAVVDSDTWTYEGKTFGLIEGLVAFDNRIMVIADHNDLARKGDGALNSTFFEFRLP